MYLLCGQAEAANSRSTYIFHTGLTPTFKNAPYMVLDTAHQQIFTAWTSLDLVEVDSTVDYHKIATIPVLSPESVDISPDGATLAVANSSEHLQFFSTTTYAKTNDVVYPASGNSIIGFLYTNVGGVLITASGSELTTADATVFWNASTNIFSTADPNSGTAYTAANVIARSADYTRVVLGYESGDDPPSGSTQVIDGTSGTILYSLAQPSYALAANNNGSRLAFCLGGTDLLILNSSFQPVYQDEFGCTNMLFSSDGGTLYRDIYTEPNSDTLSALYTEAINMTTFAGTYYPNYYTKSVFNNPVLDNQTIISEAWQAADSTGMLYGVSSTKPNIPTTSTLPYYAISPWMALDTTSSVAPYLPNYDVTTGQLQIQSLSQNVGSPQGGDLIILNCTGFNPSNISSATVTIGGVLAKINTTYTNTSSDASAGTIIQLYVNTPAGIPGLADVTLSVAGSTYTASKAFQYVNSSTTIPFTTSPTYLLYDKYRNLLYASHGAQVEVINVATKQLQTPLVPASGKLSNSQFAGLSLSPDGSRLYIADTGAGLVHVLNLNSPETGTSINPGSALGTTTISPTNVYQLANGMLIGGGSISSSPPQLGIFLINPNTLSGSWLTDTTGKQLNDYIYGTIEDGAYALIGLQGSYGTQSPYFGLTDGSSASNIALYTQNSFGGVLAADEDGTIFASGSSTASSMLYDANQYELGVTSVYFDNYGDVSGYSLHPSGALAYRPTNLSGGNGAGYVEIDDLHLGQVAAGVVLPGPMNTVSYYTTYQDYVDTRNFTTDPTGQDLFAITTSGISIMVLNTVPLSIGNLQPAMVQPGVGAAITVRGSGFVSGAEVSIDGTSATTSYVDTNTLSIQAPALTSGWHGMTVTLPSGSSYTASGILQVAGTATTPAISGFSPSSIVTGATSVLVQGLGFDGSDVVYLNGLPATATVMDSGDVNVSIPSSLVTEAGSISVSVVSPRSGSSNTATLQVLNPVPVMSSVNQNYTVAPGTSLFISSLYASQIVPNSTVLWNGIDLNTISGAGVYLEGGKTVSGLSAFSFTIPASLTTTTGTAKLTIFNPAPGGGVSSPVYVDISAAHPLVQVFVDSNTLGLSTTYQTIPSTIDVGSSLLNTQNTITFNLANIGDAIYEVTSVAISPGSSGFSLGGNTCTPLNPVPYHSSCILSVNFDPTSTGVQQATLMLTDNAPGSPHSIVLTGTGANAPVVNSFTAFDYGLTNTIKFSAFASVNAANITGTAWLEYSSTDMTLGTYSQTTPSTVTFSNTNNVAGVNGSATGLLAGTVYAVRVVFETAGGVGMSGIQYVVTSQSPPEISFASTGSSNGTVTVSPGQTAVLNLTASDGGTGYVGGIALSCYAAQYTTVPTGTTCSVSPSTITIGQGSTPFTVSITTTAPSTALMYPQGADKYGAMICCLLGLGALATLRKARRMSLLLCMVAFASTITACGGGTTSNSSSSSTSSSGGGTTTVIPGTAAGTYYFTISATSAVTGNPVNTYQVSMTVN